MKPLLSLTLLFATTVALFSAASVQASTILFQDDFEAAFYGDNAGLVTGPGYLGQGIWQSNDLAGGTWAPSYRSIISTNRAVSGSRSLALQVLEDGDRAQPLAFLSADGTTASATTQGIKISFSFNLTEVGDSASTTFVLRNTAGDNISVLNLGSDGVVGIETSAGRQTLGSIQANQWYTLELQLPGSPTTGSAYSINLLQGSTSINSATVNTLNGGDYNYLSIYSNAAPGVNYPYTAYVDDLRVEVIPEPGSLALASMGFVGTFLFAKHLRVRSRENTLE